MAGSRPEDQGGARDSRVPQTLMMSSLSPAQPAPKGFSVQRLEIVKTVREILPEAAKRHSAVRRIPGKHECMNNEKRTRKTQLPEILNTPAYPKKGKRNCPAPGSSRGRGRISDRAAPDSETFCGADRDPENNAQ